jgi:hypothetical protein
MAMCLSNDHWVSQVQIGINRKWTEHSINGIEVKFMLSEVWTALDRRRERERVVVISHTFALLIQSSGSQIQSDLIQIHYDKLHSYPVHIMLNTA